MNNYSCYWFGKHFNYVQSFKIVLKMTREHQFNFVHFNEELSLLIINKREKQNGLNFK
jgi:hypothetical protein